jgi:hypothetical protein
MSPQLESRGLCACLRYLSIGCGSSALRLACGRCIQSWSPHVGLRRQLASAAIYLLPVAVVLALYSRRDRRLDEREAAETFLSATA